MILFPCLTKPPLHPSGLESHWVSGFVRVQSNGPPLKTRMSVHIALKNLKRNALLSEALGEGEPTHASPDNEDMHPDDFRLELTQVR